MDITQLIQSGSVNPWLYIPFAILIGALHALEPGHSKSLMAGFIVAIRGTPAQAVLLGLSAAVGHTIIVWLLAIVGLWIGDKLILERATPWLTLVSGIVVVILAIRLFRSVPGFRARRHDGHHGHDGGHSHHGDHSHDGGHADSHAHVAAHERDIQRKFAGRQNVSTWEVAWFGFTGGLMPCPSALAVLLICLQTGAFALGLTMVAAFSVGLAIALVSVGVLAVWGASKASSRWPGLEAWFERVPVVSAFLVFAIGTYMIISGAMALV